MGHPLQHTERRARALEGSFLQGGVLQGAARLLSGAAVAGCAVLASCVVLTGCAVTQTGASDADLAQAKSRAARGASLFDTACASCHGPRGEGLAGAPTVIGVTALPRYPRDQAGVQLYQDPNQVQRQNQDRVPGVASRVEFVTALDLHGYLKRHVTEVKQLAASVPTEEDCWALVNFMLIANGSSVPPEEISGANAAAVSIRQQ